VRLSLCEAAVFVNKKIAELFQIKYMCQFETPTFIIYSYISVIILSIITAQSILRKNPRHSLNQDAFSFISIIVLWTAIDLGRWLSHDVKLNFLFFRLSYIIDFFFLFFLYFSYSFVGKKLSQRKKVFFALPLLVTVFAIAGNYGIGTVDELDCSYNFSWLIIFSLIFSFVYSTWASAVLLRRYYHPTVNYKTKLQIKVLVFAIILSVMWGIAYEIVDILSISHEWGIEISPYFILGNLFFIALIIFNIIEYDLFDFDVLPQKWFTFAVLTTIFGGMFFLALTPIVFLCILLFYSTIMWIFWAR
jgi:hypothetical protein